ncbi:T9SS type A sorting domain-containing protein [Hymenobacter sp. BT664]|uniref:T9SS type A sorting domain-containing protein n=1 Tax=Hymenobacter montanus TaxID=2771359 RepID=A0A927BAE7_9BACT|nr:T9SS type A sorting domain-containing protein [Hymenobacter montanus]MBD2766549.1 T9SS type A sorting domain-containing protein [Hymenobacter montanus]
MYLFNQFFLRLTLITGLVIAQATVSHAQVVGSTCIDYVAPTLAAPNPTQQIYTYTYQLGSNQTFVSWTTRGDVQVVGTYSSGNIYAADVIATDYGRGRIEANVSTGGCGATAYGLTVNKSFAKLADTAITIPPGCIEANKTYAFTVPPIVSSAAQIAAQIGIDSYTWVGFPEGSKSTYSGDRSAVTVTMPASLSGSFTVQVQIGTCNNGQIMQRTVNFQPTRPDLTLVAGTATCKTDLAAFTISYTPQPAVNYLWSIPSGWTISPVGANTGVGVSYTSAQLTASPTQTVTITPTTASIEDISVTAKYGSGSCSETPSLPFRVTRQLTTAANPITVSPASCLTPGTSVTFSVANAPANAALTWTLPGADWAITSSTATSIMATVGASGGNVTATASGCTGGSVKSVDVSPLITTAANPITVSPASCLTAGNSVTFSVANVPANTSLTWTLPGADWVITSPSSTGTSITATIGASGGNVTATAAGCGGGSVKSVAVSALITTSANPITVSLASCLIAGNSVTFSVANVPANTTLAWTLPGAGWAITSSTATSITATIGASGGNVTATAAGCGGGSVKSVAVSPLITTTANPITVSPTGCLAPGSTVTFSLANAPTNTTLTWTLPGADWVITSPNSTGTTITATVGATGGNVTTTAAGCTGGSVKSVVVSGVGNCPASTYSVYRGGPKYFYLDNANAACLPDGNGAANSGITYTWTAGSQTTTVANGGPAVLFPQTVPPNTAITVRIQDANTCLDVTVGGVARMALASREARKAPAPVRGESLSSYPNPTKSELHVDLTLEQGTAQLLVTDMLGRTVQQTTTEQAHTQLDVSKLATGAYMLRAILPSGKTLSQQIQVQH